jgi:adenylate kinase
MICVLFGPPGSGKGTQAEMITQALGVPHVSTGELLRAEAATGTALGHEVAPVLEAGGLVPDAVIEHLLGRRLEAPDAAAGAILDGYPRTVPQARDLDGRLATAGRRVDVVLVLEVGEPTLMERLNSRAAEQHRADDNPASIAERLAEHRLLTEPVLDYYRSEGVPVREVDGTGDIHAVHRRVLEALSSAGFRTSD